jgi:hypothetical protein
VSGWVVVTRDSYEAWEATTEPSRDADLRFAVLAFVRALQLAGPPPEAVLDPLSAPLFARVDETGVWIEYIVPPYLSPPAIAIRQYHR